MFLLISPLINCSNVDNSNFSKEKLSEGLTKKNICFCSNHKIGDDLCDAIYDSTKLKKIIPYAIIFLFIHFLCDPQEFIYLGS